MRFTFLGISLLAWALPAVAADPPLCTDQNILRKFQHYGVLTESGLQIHQIRSTEDVRETGYGPPPRGVNQYAPSSDHYNKSRYCEAHILLDNDETDRVYFRIDGLKDGPVDDFNFDACFLKQDVFENGCANQRPSR